MAIPGNANLLLLTEAAGAAPTGYTIDRSVRFNSADSAYLSKNFGSAGNRKTWTWAGWVKRSSFNNGGLFGNYLSDDTFGTLFFFSDTLQFSCNTTWFKTSQVLRDPSAWYHIVLAVDTTSGTPGDRIRLYINGSEVNNFDTENNPSQNANLGPINGTDVNIGRDGGNYFNGYLADVHFIDGQALDPTSFGEFDDNGVWQPIDASGLTYGTNGFHLDFADNSSAAALGYDAAGSNDWTVNNISVTAGAGNDSLRDSPTNGDTADDTGAGGEVPGNYATLNPLAKSGGNRIDAVNGNLDADGLSYGNWGNILSTIAVSSGKWYAEFTVATAGLGVAVGILDVNPLPSTYSNDDQYMGRFAKGYGYRSDSGNKVNNNSATSYGATFTNGDVIGVALDLDAGTLVFYKNNTSQGTAFSSLSGTFAFAVATVDSVSLVNCNFGQRAFAYSAPSGYKALCTANLDDPTIADGSTAMDVALYTGTGSSQAITGLEFSPDFVWIKNRSSGASSHALFDTVRGADKRLRSNGTDAELSPAIYGTLSSFDSNGFTVAPGSSDDIETCNLNDTYVAWTWDGGSSTVSNTDGSITSSVRANASAGFSIVTYTGTGATGGTVGHGLNSAPGFIIIKNRDRSIVWVCYHSGIGSGSYLLLNTTDAKTNDATYWGAGITSTTFGLQANNASGINYLNENHVAYCFAPVEGYSAFGSYTGNGSSDGPFVYTGFRPRWVMIKPSSTTGAWQINDANRNPYNVVDSQLYADFSNAESTTADRYVDFLSNGFKLRGNNASLNGSGSTYIYVCFAENPFSIARAR